MQQTFESKYNIDDIVIFIKHDHKFYKPNNMMLVGKISNIKYNVNTNKVEYELIIGSNYYNTYAEEDEIIAVVPYAVEPYFTMIMGEE